VTGTIRVVSWNIRKAVGLDWKRAPERILDVIASLKADIVLLQESDKRLAPRRPALPLDMVAQAGWTAIDADPLTPSIGHHGNAILLGQGFSFSRLHTMDLPGLEPRGGVLAAISGANVNFTIGSLHLGLRQKDRIRQMAHTLDAVRSFGGPAILGGDFNEWRGRDKDKLVPHDAPWHEIAPGPTFHTARPRLTRDRFVVDTGIKVLDMGVVPAGDMNRASDHLPIWADLKFGTDHVA
jgi:endonuclease/exonuclease/phosphatase family metal-dependent hydrolase